MLTIRTIAKVIAVVALAAQVSACASSPYSSGSGGYYYTNTGSTLGGLIGSSMGRSSGNYTLSGIGSVLGNAVGATVGRVMDQPGR